MWQRHAASDFSINDGDEGAQESSDSAASGRALERFFGTVFGPAVIKWRYVFGGCFTFLSVLAMAEGFTM